MKTNTHTPIAIASRSCARKSVDCVRAHACRLACALALAFALSTTALAFEPDVILDDADTASVEFVGSWQVETNVGNAFRGGSKVTTSTTQNSNEYARFHTTLPKTGPWRVFIWHNGLGGTGFADALDATIKHADSTATTVGWNSRGNAGEWRLLGVFWFDAAVEAVVKIPHNDSGKMSADAVMFSYAEADVVVKMSGSAPSGVTFYPSTTNWALTGSDLSGYNGSVRRTATSGAKATAFPVIPAAGEYDVSMWIPQSNGAWVPSGGTMAASIPVEVHHRGGFASLNVTVPTTGANEGGWVRVGTAPFLFDATPPAGQPNPTPAKFVIKTTGVTAEYVPAAAVGQGTD